MNLLCVPIQVDALVANDVQSVIGASEKFEALPFQDANKLDINSQQPFLASAVARRAFNNMASLPKGVHFHWSLPDALTRGKSHDDRLDMPVVPDRWLIQRIKQGKDGIDKQWVVESNYLYPPHMSPERAVQIPAPDKGESGMPPYRYLGRQLTLAQWQAEKEKNIQHEYLDELTVLGWGTPYFSSLYTECYSVFGAYDDEVSIAEMANYQYRIYGWHSCEKDDFVQKNLMPTDQMDTAMQRSLAADQANWLLPEDSSIVDNALYFGSVIFKNNLNLSDNIAADTAKLCFAKTSTEAVATYVSKCITSSEQDAIRIENQLQAALFSEVMAGENIDFVNRLKMARHKEGFRPIPSMVKYSYTAFTSLLSEQFDKARKVTFKQAYLEFCVENQATLDALNSSLDQLDKSTQQLSSLRQQLYTDWSKYMQCRYPVDHHTTAPDADLVRHMIEQQSLPVIETLPELLDEIKQQVNAYKEQIDLAFVKFCQIQKVSQASDIIADVLLGIPGSQYWQAKEPSLMITGDIVKSSTRHGTDGDLTCLYHTTNGNAIIDWLLDSNDMDNDIWPDRAKTEWHIQPWNPLCVEWRLDLHAESDDELSSTSNQINYNPNFITSRYRVPLNDNEFSLPGASVDYFYKNQNGIIIDDNPNVVYGRSLLTFMVKDKVKDKFKKALESLEDTDHDISGELTNTLKEALNYIDNNHILTQQLDGFHENLLMYADESSLCIDDPLEFASINDQDKSFTERVKQALDNDFYKQPSIGHQFTPIKSGTTQLTNVRVIDSFGRFKDLDCTHVTFPQRDVVGNTMYTPPRILQPLRLDFRWKNRLEAVTQSETPICGWIDYNLVDETIVCYNTAGIYMGSINSDGEWADKNGVLQTLHVIDDQKLETFVLKLLSFHKANRISRVAQGADISLWTLLHENNLLVSLDNDHDFSLCSKAQVRPLTEDNWPGGTGLSLSEARHKIATMSAHNNYLPALKKAIQRAQDNIESSIVNEQAQGISIKPLAILSATLDLQLYGFQETNKSWAALLKDLETNERSSRCYGDVKFPIKLGEYRNLDDGLVAYWRVNQNGSLSHHGSFPQSDMKDIEGWIDGASFIPDEFDYIDAVDEEGINNIEQSLNDEPFELLMLMDPKCVIHATTGIVPKKLLRLDSSLYLPGLEVMQERYFAAPLLTPASTLSLPLTRKNAWSFQQINSAGEYEEISSIPLIDKAVLTLMDDYKDGDWDFLIQNKVLKVVSGTESKKAYFMSPSADKLLEIADVWSRLELILMKACRGGIVSPENVAPFNQRVVALEGWIESAPNQVDE